MEEKFKIKPLSKQQIQIAFDRLTRFKFTEDKYLRVFKETILSNLIEPKFKKTELNSLDYSKITHFAELIFNFSIEKNGAKLTNNFSINEKLKKYEESVFIFDNDTKKLLNNKIDYKAGLKILNKEIPINLKWLISLENNEFNSKNREISGLKFPLEKVIIAEGITEEILLPKFAKQIGFDFDKEGITIISAGGKNQVVKLFYRLSEILKLPIFVLLDNDASENYKEILPKLRPKDKVHVLKSGEFEDTLPIPLIQRTLNNYLKNFSKVEITELEQDIPMTHILEEIFKTKGFSEFKKAEFANMIAQNLQKDDFSPEINQVFEEIKAMPELIK